MATETKIPEEDMKYIASLAERSGLLSDEVLNGCKIGEHDVPGIHQISEKDGCDIGTAIDLWESRNSWRFLEEFDALCLAAFIPTDRETGEPFESTWGDGSVHIKRNCFFLINAEGGLVGKHTDWDAQKEFEVGKCYHIRGRDAGVDSYDGTTRIHIADFKETPKIEFGDLETVELSDVGDHMDKSILVEGTADFSDMRDLSEDRVVFHLSKRGSGVLPVFIDKGLVEGLATGKVTLYGRVGRDNKENVILNARVIVR